MARTIRQHGGEALEAGRGRAPCLAAGWRTERHPDQYIVHGGNGGVRLIGAAG